MNAAFVTTLLYIVGFLVIYFICRIFIRPFKWIFRLLISCVLGALAMSIANKLLIVFGIGFSINPLTALISGVLGLPGLIMTLVLSCVL